MANLSCAETICTVNKLLNAIIIVIPLPRCHIYSVVMHQGGNFCKMHFFFFAALTPHQMHPIAKYNFLANSTTKKSWEGVQEIAKSDFTFSHLMDFQNSHQIWE